MSTGVQWTGHLNPNQTQTWFTFNWPASWHVVWYMMPTTPNAAREVNWSVAVERAANDYVTYWITVSNLTGQAIDFEGRYAILN
jgi:hypothetical protein